MLEIQEIFIAQNHVLKYVPTIQNTETQNHARAGNSKDDTYGGQTAVSLLCASLG